MCLHAKLRIPGGSEFTDARWQARNGLIQVHGRSNGRAKSRDRKIGNEGFKKDERGKGVLRQEGSEKRDGDIPATLLSVHNPALGTHAWTHRGLFLLLSAWETKQEFHKSSKQKCGQRGPQLSCAISGNVEWNICIFKMQK